MILFLLLGYLKGGEVGLWEAVCRAAGVVEGLCIIGKMAREGGVCWNVNLILIKLFRVITCLTGVVVFSSCCYWIPCKR